MVRAWFKDLFWPLIWPAVALSVLGLLFIHSASYGSGQYAVKQSFWLAVGVVSFMITVAMGYRSFLSMSYLIYTFSILLLLYVFIGGTAHLGAQRWIHVGPVVVQPSEFAKVATLLAVANYLGSREAWESELEVISKAAGMIMLPMLLIARQPDLGTAMLFAFMLIVILFFWGMKIRYFLGALFMMALVAPFLWNGLKAYQKKRIMVFLNPDSDPLGAGYTAIQSRIAVGSGGVWGKGYMQGTQSHLDFVPEHHTDFIFCVFGEELGFLGSLLIIILYAFLFLSTFQVIHATTDLKGKILISGLIAVLFSQVFINIGMSFGLMPITGLTLPLVSYGGSSFISTCIALGLIASVYKERSIF